MVKEIPLSRGKVALVDDSDYDILKKLNWYINERGNRLYACAHFDADGRRTQRYMHRLIMNPKAHEIVDHINMNGVDNRRCNLRVVNNRLNAANRPKRKGGKSKYKGVAAYSKGKKDLWIGQVSYRGQNIQMGPFETEEEAALVYDKLALKLFGEHARVNFKSSREVFIDKGNNSKTVVKQCFNKNVSGFSMPRKELDMAKIRRIVTILRRYPGGIWLRRLAKESKVPVTTVYRYLEGVLSPFVANMGARDEDGNFMGIRVIQLKPGITKQLDQGLTIEKLIKTRTLYQEIE